MTDPNKGEKRISVSYNFKGLSEWADSLFDVERQSYIMGLNSAFGGAISTVCYESLANMFARVALPLFCGVAANELWVHYISNPLRKGEIDCPVCFTTRGTAIALATATVFPAFLGGVLLARGKFRFSNRTGHIFEESITPYRYNVSRRPLLAAAIATQVSLGFIMADREFDYAIRRAYADRELEKGRIIVNAKGDESSTSIKKTKPKESEEH